MQEVNRKGDKLLLAECERCVIQLFWQILLNSDQRVTQERKRLHDQMLVLVPQFKVRLLAETVIVNTKSKLYSLAAFRQ